MYDFIKNPNIKYLFDIFKKNKEELRLVGGCVRDTIMANPVNDYDFATTAPPEKIIEIAQKEHIYFLTHGIIHGTVTIVVNDENYEITTLRTDDETDGRHATVSFTTSWETDAERRDFTFNALYMDSEGKIYDYHNGVNDLNNRKIKFIGKAEDRIKEDSLRILRYYRFITKFKHLSLDKEDVGDIINNISLMKNLSVERIYSELTKIFSSENKWPVIELMNTHGISEFIFGKNITIPKVKLNVTPLTIFSYMTNNNIDYMRKFKASTEDINYVNDVQSIPDIDYNINENNIKRLLLDYSHEAIISKTFITMLNYKFDIVKWEKYIELVYNCKTPTFPIKGGDLLKKGFIGVEIGNKMNQLRKRWIDSNFLLTSDDMLEIL